MRKRRPVKNRNGSTYSQCLRKVAYVSYRQAERVAGEIESLRGQVTRSYICNICGSYHLTKQSAKIRSTIK